MKVVVESNVAVAGLLWEGPPNQILKWARQGFVNLLACHETVRELGRILLIQKFQPRLRTLGVSADEVCAYYMNLVSFVPSPKRIPDRIRDDPFDKLFVGLASEYGAQLIVTGDRIQKTGERRQKKELAAVGRLSSVVVSALLTTVF